jgi:hypothetical protein
MSSKISIMVSFYLLLGAAALAAAYDGDFSEAAPIVYRANTEIITETVQNIDPVLKSVNFERTRYGTAGASIDFTRNGSLIFSPAISENGIGIAISDDYGKTWSQRLLGSQQPRYRASFKNVDGRYFFWSSTHPGIDFAFSDNEGASWYHTNFPVQEGGYLISGRPVYSPLYGTTQILYFSAPSPDAPVKKLDTEQRQLLWKSLDHGATWIPTAGSPTLNPREDDGYCERLDKKTQQHEKIIWGDGFVRPNGTIMFGLRRCRRVSIAISDDEGATWHFRDIPESPLKPVAIPPPRKLSGLSPTKYLPSLMHPFAPLRLSPRSALSLP